jgi:DNA-binding transcriptional ArsR family regulator
MRSIAPAVLPIFRTHNQGEILALVLDHPEREWTVSELATATGAALTTIQSEISRLESGDLVTSRKVGRTRLVRANTGNPIIAPLTQIVLLSFGPKVVIAQEFASLEADHIVIFGSWAARISGIAGKTPDDIDVLIVSDSVKRSDAYAAAERAQERLGRPVNPVIRSTAAWQSPSSDPLLDELLRRPYVDVTDTPTEMKVDVK